MGNIPSGALSVQGRRKKEGRSCVNGQNPLSNALQF